MNDHSQNSKQINIAGLASLAEFRYLLRGFLYFSEVASEREGIQAQQYQLMQVVATLPSDDQSSISHIAERMVLRHNSTVELVDRAEKAGLVARKSDPKDLRRSLVVLTPHGEEILRRLIPLHVAEVSRIADEMIKAVEAVKRTGTGTEPQ